MGDQASPDTHSADILANGHPRDLSTGRVMRLVRQEAQHHLSVVNSDQARLGADRMRALGDSQLLAEEVRKRTNGRAAASCILA